MDKTSKRALQKKVLGVQEKTPVERFWKTYHSKTMRGTGELLRLRQQVLNHAEREDLVVKPDREPNLDRYLYALLRVGPEKRVGSGPETLETWFFNSFFQRRRV